MNVSFKIFFFTLSNTKVKFNNRKLKWGSYTAVETLLTTRQVELIVNKEFIVAAVDLEKEICIVYVVFLAIFSEIYPSCKTQIVSLKVYETFSIFLPEYFDFIAVFSPKLATELLEPTEINNHVIDFIDGKQPSYQLI